jgi:hypothetical protein
VITPPGFLLCAPQYTTSAVNSTSRVLAIGPRSDPALGSFQVQAHHHTAGSRILDNYASPDDMGRKAAG